MAKHVHPSLLLSYVQVWWEAIKEKKCHIHSAAIYRGQKHLQPKVAFMKSAEIRCEEEEIAAKEN